MFDKRIETPNDVFYLKIFEKFKADLVRTQDMADPNIVLSG
jgi:hypothetical protein